MKTTLRLQLAFGAKLLPQVLVSEKSVEFVPPTEMLVMLSAALPTFVIVTFFAVLAVPTFTIPKLKLAGISFTAVPVPESATDCVPSLSAMFNVPACLPVAVGVNFTDIVQLAPAATLVPQVLVSENSLEVAILVILSAALPLLVRVTDFAALLVPKSCLVKVRLEGDSDTGPVLSSTSMLLLLRSAVTKSSEPSPFTSPTATSSGLDPTA